MKKSVRKFALLCCLTAPLVVGCAAEKPQVSADVGAVIQDVQQQSVIKGKIAGKSNRAKTIFLTVGKGVKASTTMLRFTDETTGIEFAKKGEAAIIPYKHIDGDKVAVSVKPKLAKLPPGVVEIKTAELRAIIEEGGDIFLVDSRPVSRFNQAHLPGAVSIPIDKPEEDKKAILPKDKESLLVFYCGGPT